MISFAKKKKLKNCNFFAKDIVKANFTNADMIASMFTMQFLLPKHRQKFMTRFISL